MTSNETSTSSLWISNVATWLSSGFLSTMMLAACMVPGLWALQLNVSDMHSGSLDLSQTCNLCLMLAVAIGVSTFLANYVLLGHPTAFAGAMIAICSAGVFTNRTIFVIAVAPIILGAIAGHYLNRYTAHKAKRNANSTTWGFVALRFAVAIAAMALTANLIDNHCHWCVYPIWMAQLTLYLAFAFRGIWKRAEIQIAA